MPLLQHRRLQIGHAKGKARAADLGAAADSRGERGDGGFVRRRRLRATGGAAAGSRGRQGVTGRRRVCAAASSAGAWRGLGRGGFARRVGGGLGCGGSAAASSAASGCTVFIGSCSLCSSSDPLTQLVALKNYKPRRDKRTRPTSISLRNGQIHPPWQAAATLAIRRCPRRRTPARSEGRKEVGSMAVRAASRRLASSSRLVLPAFLSPTAFRHSHATSFGYKQVPEEEKSKLVGNVFSSVASSYDLMNDLMSVGLHRLWKDRLVSKLNPFPGMKHLDVAGGTGDVAFRVLERINSVNRRAMQGTLPDTEEDTQIYVCDINPNMLNVGKKRASERGYKEDHCLSWIQGDAEALSFEDGSMDGYTIAFGIRNVTHIEKALSEAYRVLKRGGRFLCLELSHVDVPLFKEIYDVYSFSVIPAMGELVSGDRQSYQYLVESIRRFPNQEKFARMIQEAGFERVEYENLVGGVVAIHSGLKL